MSKRHEVYNHGQSKFLVTSIGICVRIARVLSDKIGVPLSPSFAEGGKGEPPLSMMYENLPAGIKSRIAPFSSLRRRFISATISSRTTTTSNYSPDGTETRSEMSELMLSLSEGKNMRADDSRPMARIVPTATSPDGGTVVVTRADSSGMNWRLAERGNEIIARTFDRRGEVVDTVDRMFYVTGVAKLLEALPSDLDDTEERIILGALPPGLNESAALAQNFHLAGAERGWGNMESSSPRHVANKSVTHDVCFCVVMMIRNIFHMVVHYNREYKIAEQAVAWLNVMVRYIGSLIVMCVFKSFWNDLFDGASAAMTEANHPKSSAPPSSEMPEWERRRTSQQRQRRQAPSPSSHPMYWHERAQQPQQPPKERMLWS